MVALLRFIAGNAWLVSLVCLLGAVRYVWKALNVHRAGTITPYTLERESASSEAGRAWFAAVILAVASLVTLLAGPTILQSTADLAANAPTVMVAGIQTVTPTPTLPVTPTSTPPPATPTLEASATPEAMRVQADTPTPEVAPSDVPLPPNCPDPRVQIGIPANGQLVSGAIEIQGTADIPGFDYYKFEINGPLTGGEWRTIGDVWRAPIRNGVLGYWDAAPVVSQAPGLYSFRLVVVDNTGNFPPPCSIQIYIAAE